MAVCRLGKQTLHRNLSLVPVYCKTIMNGICFRCTIILSCPYDLADPDSINKESAPIAITVSLTAIS